MPTYEYACKSCGEHLEIVQSFTDEPLSVCPACGGELRKVFGNIGIVFKGNGFYKTDSRNGSKSDPDSSKVDSSKSETGADKGEPKSSDSKGESKSGSKSSESRSSEPKGESKSTDSKGEKSSGKKSEPKPSSGASAPAAAAS